LLVKVEDSTVTGQRVASGFDFRFGLVALLRSCAGFTTSGRFLVCRVSSTDRDATGGRGTTRAGFLKYALAATAARGVSLGTVTLCARLAVIEAREAKSGGSLSAYQFHGCTRAAQ
jgi:hypothetical protein